MAPLINDNKILIKILHLEKGYSASDDVWISSKKLEQKYALQS